MESLTPSSSFHELSTAIFSIKAYIQYGHNKMFNMFIYNKVVEVKAHIGIVFIINK